MSAKENHLVDQSDFIEAFIEFRNELDAKNIVLKDEENVLRLFDMWLANYKVEKVLAQQLKKDPWDTGWDNEA